jgi:hypothetical protein
MVEAGESLRADDSPAGTRLGQAAWSAWLDHKPRVRKTSTLPGGGKTGGER